MTSDVIEVGHYIIIQRQNYKKLHKLTNAATSVTLGRDVIQLAGIIGSKYFSTFKMVNSKGKQKNRTYCLEPVKDLKYLNGGISIKESGIDNRNIFDDGKSQNLTTEEISVLREEAQSSCDIVNTLIENSSTFNSKTEYSQEKYLKKKEKKYFEYIQVRKPTLRLIHEIMYRLDPGKILGIRSDTLSQILTYSNVNGFGDYLLYESGTNGLLTAVILNAIGNNTNGKLIHMHPGNMSQKQGMLAMNFENELLDRCISVNVYSVLRHYYQHDVKTSSSNIEPKDENCLKHKLENECESETKTKLRKTHSHDDVSQACIKDESIITPNEETECLDVPKTPKWHFDNLEACAVLKCKLDSLIIASREHPLNIFIQLIEFVKPGRPFVIYYGSVEILQDCYMTLKARGDIAALKLTHNWIRNYQVLPDRTHPQVLMNNNGGYLLSGYIL